MTIPGWPAMAAGRHGAAAYGRRRRTALGAAGLPDPPALGQSKPSDTSRLRAGGLAERLPHELAEEAALFLGLSIVPLLVGVRIVVVTRVRLVYQVGIAGVFDHQAIPTQSVLEQ